MTHLIRGLKDRPTENLSSMGRAAYNNSIAPFHNFFLRNAIRLIFYTVPTREHFLDKTFGKIDATAFNEILVRVLTPLEPFVEYLWKYYKERNLTGLE